LAELSNERHRCQQHSMISVTQETTNLGNEKLRELGSLANESDRTKSSLFSKWCKELESNAAALKRSVSHVPYLFSNVGDLMGKKLPNIRGEIMSDPRGSQVGESAESQTNNKLIRVEHVLSERVRDEHQ